MFIGLSFILARRRVCSGQINVELVALVNADMFKYFDRVRNEVEVKTKSGSKFLKVNIKDSKYIFSPRRFKKK